MRPSASKSNTLVPEPRAAPSGPAAAMPLSPQARTWIAGVPWYEACVARRPKGGDCCLRDLCEYRDKTA